MRSSKALVQTAVQFADANCAIFEPELGEHKLVCAICALGDFFTIIMKYNISAILLASQSLYFLEDSICERCRYTQLHNEFKQLFEELKPSTVITKAHNS